MKCWHIKIQRIISLSLDYLTIMMIIRSNDRLLLSSSFIRSIIFYNKPRPKTHGEADSIIREWDTLKGINEEWLKVALHVANWFNPESRYCDNSVARIGDILVDHISMAYDFAFPWKNPKITDRKCVHWSGGEIVTLR